MKKILLTALSMFLLVGAFAQEQQEQKIPTPEEMATKEADRLAEQLKLEYWQVFYVDSTLQYVYNEWQNEIKKLQAARVDSYDLYTRTNDKWMEVIDNEYKKIFTQQQWAAYLKSGAAKLQKAREKRKAKMEKASAVLPKSGAEK